MHPFWRSATPHVRSGRGAARTGLAAFCAALLAIVGTLFTASPAAARWDDCYQYSGTICLTGNADFTGQVWRQYPNQIGACRSLVPEGFNDEASFAWFNVPRPASAPRPHLILWRDIGCSGREGNQGFTLDPGEQWYGDRPSTKAWNDKISSISISYY